MAKNTPITPGPPAQPKLATFPGAVEGPLGWTAVTLQGGGAVDGVWLAPLPLPQALETGAATYDLSDRAAGLYTWRHR